MISTSLARNTSQITYPYRCSANFSVFKKREYTKSSATGYNCNSYLKPSTFIASNPGPSSNGNLKDLEEKSISYGRMSNSHGFKSTDRYQNPYEIHMPFDPGIKIHECRCSANKHPHDTTNDSLQVHKVNTHFLSQDTITSDGFKSSTSFEDSDLKPPRRGDIEYPHSALHNALTMSVQ